MHVGVGIHAAGDGPCFFYDGHSHPFLRLRDGTHLLARRTCEPPASCPGWADQTGTADGCRKDLGPADSSLSRQPRGGVSRIGSQAGTQAPDPTPPPGHYRGSRARSTIHTLPAEYEREDYQTLALLEVRILPDSVSGQAGELSGYGSRCRCRWLARPPHSRGVRRIGVALPVMVFPSPAVALWLWRFGLLCRRMDVG